MTLHTAQPRCRSSAGTHAHGLAFALGGSLLLAVLARVQVPFCPVPLTLQTLVVLLLARPWREGSQPPRSRCTLLEGLAGLPVFADAVARPGSGPGPRQDFWSDSSPRRRSSACRRPAVGPLLDPSPRLARSRPRRRVCLRLFTRPARRRAEAFAARASHLRVGDDRRTLLAVALVGTGRSAVERSATPEPAPVGMQADPGSPRTALPGGFSPNVRGLATRWSANGGLRPLRTTSSITHCSIRQWTRSLVEAGLLGPASSPIIGLVRRRAIPFLSRPAFPFPEPAEVRRHGRHLGRSSVRYHLAGSKPGHRGRAAGRSTHVYVERRRTAPVPIAEGLGG